MKEYDVNGLEVQAINEFSMSRFVDFLQHKRPIAIVSGWRGDNTSSENDANNRAIEAAIRSQNFGFVKVKGGFTENLGQKDQRDVLEDSILFTGKPGEGDAVKALAVKLGAKYKQDSVFFSGDDGQASYISTTGNVGSVQHLGAFHPQQIGEYFTQLRKGRKKFTFDQIQEANQIVPIRSYSHFVAISVNRTRFLHDKPFNDGIDASLVEQLKKDGILDENGRVKE
jgi:hypothetical protein